MQRIVPHCKVFDIKVLIFELVNIHGPLHLRQIRLVHLISLETRQKYFRVTILAFTCCCFLCQFVRVGLFFQRISDLEKLIFGTCFDPRDVLKRNLCYLKTFFPHLKMLDVNGKSHPPFCSLA